MQPAIVVEFEGAAPPDAVAIAQAVTASLGVSVTHHVGRTVAGQTSFLLSLTGGESAELVARRQGVVLLVDVPPSHFQWAIALALEQLGGQSNRPAPSFARKKLGELSFWERLQLRQRFFGR
jgi:hypothetical protein